MSDWLHYVRQHLKLSSLSPVDEAAAIEEIAQQLDDAYQDALRRGVPPADAADEAKLHITDWEGLARELTLTMRSKTQKPSVETRRRMRPAGAIEWLFRDLRFAARRLRKSSGFTLVAMLTLGVGIGANTAIFGVFDSILIRPLPYPQADQLVVLDHSAPGVSLKSTGASPANTKNIESPVTAAKLSPKPNS